MKNSSPDLTQPTQDVINTLEKRIKSGLLLLSNHKNYTSEKFKTMHETWFQENIKYLDFIYSSDKFAKEYEEVVFPWLRLTTTNPEFKDFLKEATAENSQLPNFDSNFESEHIYSSIQQEIKYLRTKIDTIKLTIDYLNNTVPQKEKELSSNSKVEVHEPLQISDKVTVRALNKVEQESSTLVKGENKKICKACRKQLLISASKCPHCGSYQGFRKHLTFLNLTIGTILSLAALIGIIIPIFKTQKLRLTFHSSNEQTITLNTTLPKNKLISLLPIHRFTFTQSEDDHIFILTSQSKLQNEPQYLQEKPITLSFTEHLFDIEKAYSKIGRNDHVDRTNCVIKINYKVANNIEQLTEKIILSDNECRNLDNFVEENFIVSSDKP